MKQIAILSSSVRTGASSPRVAQYFKQYIESNQLAEASIIDLAEYNFPVFEERLKFLENPSDKVLDFSAKIKAADAIIIVTPEYNGGYPASLKNAIDLLYEEWKRKPIAISMVSSGAFAGTQVITSLLFTLWKIGATMVPTMFPVASVQNNFDESGNTLQDKEGIDKRAASFIKELLWYTEKLNS
jgi:NAD(P)H-dependent FMN reductase